jgi:hypothetical protein
LQQCQEYTVSQPFYDEDRMRAIAQSGRRLSEHIRETCLDCRSPDANTVWSTMSDEIAVAALLDPTVIRESETLYFDAVIQQGPKYGSASSGEDPRSG